MTGRYTINNNLNNNGGESTNDASTYNGEEEDYQSNMSASKSHISSDMGSSGRKKGRGGSEVEHRRDLSE